MNTRDLEGRTFGGLARWSGRCLATLLLLAAAAQAGAGIEVLSATHCGNCGVQIAHSMGNRALTQAFVGLVQEHPALTAPGIDTIDASKVDTSLLGHSYVGDSASVLKDLANLFAGHQRALERAGLDEVVVAQGRYWQLNR